MKKKSERKFSVRPRESVILKRSQTHTESRKRFISSYRLIVLERRKKKLEIFNSKKKREILLFFPPHPPLGEEKARMKEEEKKLFIISRRSIYVTIRAPRSILESSEMWKRESLSRKKY